MRRARSRSWRRSRTRARGQRGLTLLELMVAISILGIVLVAFYGTFTRTLAGRDLAVRRTAEYATARSVIDRIERDLEGSFDTGLYAQGFPRFYAPAPDTFSLGRDDRVVLDLTVASARGVALAEGGVDIPGLTTAPGRGDQARVIYRIEGGDAGRLVRYELRPPRPVDVDFDTAPHDVLARGVRTLDLRFFDGTDWVESWDSSATGSQHGVAPREVETHLVLEPTDEDDPEVDLLTATVLPLGGAEGSAQRSQLPAGQGRHGIL